MLTDVIKNAFDAVLSVVVKLTLVMLRLLRIEASRVVTVLDVMAREIEIIEARVVVVTLIMRRLALMVLRADVMEVLVTAKALAITDNLFVMLVDTELTIFEYMRGLKAVVTLVDKVDRNLDTVRDAELTLTLLVANDLLTVLSAVVRLMELADRALATAANRDVIVVETIFRLAVTTRLFKVPDTLVTVRIALA